MQMITTTIFYLGAGLAATDKPNALKLTLFTILICCSRKKGFRHLFTFTIKALTCTYVLAGLAHFTYSASIV